MGIRCNDHVIPLYPQKLALTSPTGGGRSVGIVRSRTKATEFSLVMFIIQMFQISHVWLQCFIIITQPETKDNLCIAAMILFNILLKCYNNKFVNFTKVYYHIQPSDLNLSGASVAPTSEVGTSALLLVLAVGSEEVLHYVHTKFIENWPSLAKVKMDGPTDNLVI